MRNRFRAVRNLTGHVAREYSAYGVPKLSAALAYYAATSMAPMLVVVIAIAGFAVGSGQAGERLVQQASSTIGPRGAELLQNLFSNMNAPHRGWIATLASAGAILISSTVFFSELHDSLNTIWQAKPRREGGAGALLLLRLEAFAMVAGIGFCITLSVIAGFAINAAGQQIGRWIPASETVLRVTDSLLALALVTFFFALIFRFVPDKRLPWPNIFAGAIVTAILFVAGKIGISYYIGRTGVGSVYGAAGSLLAVLVWVYYSAQVFLIGAILTHTFATARCIGTDAGERGAA